MSNTMRDVVGRLSEITARDPINWNAFDSVLAEVEDINIYDEDDEETILSDLIKFHRSEVLAEIIRHFLSHGYDVTANEGINGGLALSALRWASNDHHILKAAKVLMDAGAPMNYRSIDDDEEPDGVLGDISWSRTVLWSMAESPSCSPMSTIPAAVTLRRTTKIPSSPMNPVNPPLPIPAMKVSAVGSCFCL